MKKINWIIIEKSKHWDYFTFTFLNKYWFNYTVTWVFSLCSNFLKIYKKNWEILIIKINLFKIIKTWNTIFIVK